MKLDDVPQILPRNAGNAYEIFSAAQREGMTLWLTWPRGMVVLSRARPTKHATRMAFVDKNNPEAA